MTRAAVAAIALALTGAGCWVNPPAVTPAVAPPTVTHSHSLSVEEPAPRPRPRAVGLLAEMVETYAVAGTYTDRGDVVIAGAHPRRLAFATVFVRPDALRLDFEIQPSPAPEPPSRDPRPDASFVLWTIGPAVYSAWPQKNAQRARSVEVALSSAAGISSLVSSTVPQMLRKGMVSGRAALADASVVGEDTIGGHVCWQVAGIGPNREPVTLSIDEASHLLRRTYTRVRSTGEPIAITTTYEPIVDAPVDATQLAGPDIAVETTAPPAAPPTVSGTAPPRPRPLGPVVLPVSPLVGKPAPDFTADAIGAAEPTVHLAALAGHVVVIDFWATWCGPCKLAMPGLEALAAAHAAAGLRVIGLSAEDPGDLRDFLATHKLGYTIARDATGQGWSAYRVGPIPMLAVIDKRGVVRAVLLGARHDAELEALVASLLAEP